jgi:hypothetical protein
MISRLNPKKSVFWNHRSATLCVCALIVWGCGGTPPPATVIQRSPAKAQSPFESGKALPADFSTTLPVYPGAMVERVRKPKGAMREVYFTAGGKLDPMIQYYKTALDKGGYEITATLKMATRKTWSCDFHKGGQQASVMIFPSDKDQTLMTIDLIYEIPSTATAAADPSVEEFDVVGPGEIVQSSANQSEKRN